MLDGMHAFFLLQWPNWLLISDVPTFMFIIGIALAQAVVAWYVGKLGGLSLDALKRPRGHWIWVWFPLTCIFVFTVIVGVRNDHSQNDAKVQGYTAIGWLIEADNLLHQQRNDPRVDEIRSKIDDFLRTDPKSRSSLPRSLLTHVSPPPTIVPPVAPTVVPSAAPTVVAQRPNWDSPLIAVAAGEDLPVTSRRETLT
jgi:hypothetical protein